MELEEKAEEAIDGNGGDGTTSEQQVSGQELQSSHMDIDDPTTASADIAGATSSVTDDSAVAIGSKRQTPSDDTNAASSQPAKRHQPDHEQGEHTGLTTQQPLDTTSTTIETPASDSAGLNRIPDASNTSGFIQSIRAELFKAKLTVETHTSDVKRYMDKLAGCQNSRQQSQDACEKA